MTLIYDLPGRGGGIYPGGRGGFTRAGGGGFQILSKIIQTQNVPNIDDWVQYTPVMAEFNEFIKSDKSCSSLIIIKFHVQ